MSGLYNVLFGVNRQADVLLHLLGKDRSDFGRFRDAYITDKHIVVYTRCGGFNRESYGEVFDEMEDHPLYQYDEDDNYDNTYASFYFNFPEEYADDLKAQGKESYSPSEKWTIMIAALDGQK